MEFLAILKKSPYSNFNRVTYLLVPAVYLVGTFSKGTHNTDNFVYWISEFIDGNFFGYVIHVSPLFSDVTRPLHRAWKISLDWAPKMFVDSFRDWPDKWIESTLWEQIDAEPISAALKQKSTSSYPNGNNSSKPSSCQKMSESISMAAPVIDWL
jgi:hypothetical protein